MCNVIMFIRTAWPMARWIALYFVFNKNVMYDSKLPATQKRVRSMKGEQESVWGNDAFVTESFLKDEEGEKTSAMSLIIWVSVEADVMRCTANPYSITIIIIVIVYIWEELTIAFLLKIACCWEQTSATVTIVRDDTTQLQEPYGLFKCRPACDVCRAASPELG